MKSNLTRREWFRSAVAASATIPLSLSVVQDLMAAPVSKAEMDYLDFYKSNPKLIRLGSNENPYGPSPKARDAIKASITEGNRYGFDATDELKQMIAAKEGVSVDHILMGAGSGEMLALTGMGLGLEGGSVLSAWPTFPMLMNFATKFNARWDKVNLDQNHVHDLEAMASAVKDDTKVLFVVNPNNPTGTVLDPARLKSFWLRA